MKITGFFSSALKKIKNRRKQYELESMDGGHTPDFYGKEKSKDNVIQLEIATSTLLKIGLVIVGFLFVVQIFYQIQEILIISGICFFLAMGLSPILDTIENSRIPKWLATVLGFGIPPIINLIRKFRTPRWLAILLIYLLFFGALAILFVQILPIVADQLIEISDGLQARGVDIPYLEELKNIYNNKINLLPELLNRDYSELYDQLKSIFTATIDVLVKLFKNIFNFMFALVLLFFILLEREGIARFTLALFPAKDRQYIQEKSLIVQTKMAKWFRGQVILMIAMGFFMYAGMKILEETLGMKYSATIGLLAGFMELFPYIGSLMTGALALLVAINVSWILFFIVLGWIALSQFLEGNFLVPIVMEKVVGLSSVTVMLVLAIGGTLGAAVGGPTLSILAMILAVPTAASISIFVEEYANRDQKNSKDN